MKRFYVGLDELLDTRLGFISTLNPELVKQYLDPLNDRYFKRVNDTVFYQDLGITKERWYELYSRRDVSVLQNSVMTHIVNVINTIIKMYHESNEHALADLDVILTVNTYPYLLQDNERQMITELLSQAIPLVSEVRYIHLPYKTLTPSLLKTSYDYVIMYEYDLWTMLHASDLKKILMPSIHFFVPRLMQQIPTEAEFEDDPELKEIWKLDPFKLMEMIISPKLGLTYIAASDFSTALRNAITPDHPVEDLDHLIDQSGSYKPHTTLYDPQFPIHPAPNS